MLCCVNSCVACVMLNHCVYVCAQNKQEEADEVKRRFAGDSRSDHIALLNAYKVFYISIAYHHTFITDH